MKNSVIQFFIPGKGKFTLVLQEEDDQSIQADVEKNPQHMFTESEERYNQGLGISTSDFLKSLSKKDFM